MVSINLDDLDHITAVRLRARAAGNECSSEEEALNLLRFALVERGIRLPPPEDWVLAIRERFKPLGIVDIIIPPRSTGEPMQWIFEEDDDEWEKNNPIPTPDEALADELRIRALANDCSVEEEALNVLRFALEKPARPAPAEALGRGHQRAVQRPRLRDGSPPSQRGSRPCSPILLA